ncbi:ABC transporter substrate-binding protein [Dyadobacter aurulentus]|uniref:ABC transporter substrate-binding protein n=1 Tax=Dyadobacter sp. UC 10 TaxID=2605428 RepID=UPI0011F349F6|nr:ABC transporter substrate-binding protein [Dyadobacter sp. UC 10]KAA0990080.1 ABC transporter substrate-binding protein [Dyadobacter sp. UC 10]
MKNLFLLPLIFVLLQGCNTDKTSQEQQQGRQGKTSYSDTTGVRYAKGFSIRYFDQYKIVSIKSADPNSPEDQYILLEKGISRPEGFPDAQVIQIPLKSMVAMSSMHIGLLEFLGAESILTGLGSLQYVYSPSVNGMIKGGKVAEVGRDNGLNQEKLVEMHPDLVMTVGAPGAKKDSYTILKQAGIPVLANSEWIETTPLARMEWVKLAAALLNKEKVVNEKFDVIEKEYHRLTRLAGSVSTKPSVISGLNIKDIWFLPNGENYMSQFLKDAGADYYWGNTRGGGSLSLSFETVYPKALEAQYWVNVGFDKNDTRKSILAQDSRYTDFKAAKSGKMYSYNSRVNAQGANDFFESGTINPHTVLADLIHIFHPELLPGHQLVYYKQLP